MLRRGYYLTRSGERVKVWDTYYQYGTGQLIWRGFYGFEESKVREYLPDGKVQGSAHFIPDPDHNLRLDTYEELSSNS